VARPVLPWLLAGAALLGGCSVPGGQADGERAPEPTATRAPAASPGRIPVPIGAPVSTRNTSRIPGDDAVADAAGAALAVFPGPGTTSRPGAVVLVDAADWQGVLAASALVGSPLRAPTLLTAGTALPPDTRAALDVLDPPGDDAVRRAQVLRLGHGPGAPGLRAALIAGSESPDPYARAAAVDGLLASLSARPSRDVIVASGEDPRYAMPAAAWAGRSADAVLLTRRDVLPAPTRERIAARRRARIHVLGPRSVVGTRVERELRRLGTVRRIAGATPVENAIAFARYGGGSFGWGVTVPGHNFTLASIERPLDAAAAGVLGSNGVFAPLLLTDRPDRLPRALESYLLDVQPGYEDDPAEAVYNRIWILGDERAVSVPVQARLDEVAALVPVGG
jgi:hypothetical protein